MNKRVICIIANGYAEEMMATNLMSQIHDELKTQGIDVQFQFVGGSLVSSGQWFHAAKYPTFFTGGMMPSGGFPTKSLAAFFLDLEAGAFLKPFKMAKLLKKWTNYHLELVVVVGDFLLMATTIPALRKKKTPLVFIPTAKSDHIQSHFLIEKAIIKQYATVAFPRDKATVFDFHKSHINVLDCGNMIQDLIDYQAPKITSSLPIVALLPGSREEAYGNLEMMLQILMHVTHPTHWALARANSVSIDKIHEVFSFYKWICDNIESPIPIWKKDKREIHCYPGSMFDSVALSCDLAISLAGTGGEQIIGLGKPVIGFKGTGPQSSHQRMLDNAKLLGDAFIYIPKSENVAPVINKLLGDSTERERLGVLGKKRMGFKGATKCISQYIVKYIIQNPVR